MFNYSAEEYLRGLDLDSFFINSVSSPQYPMPVASNLDHEIGSQENSILFIETNTNLTEFHAKLLCAFESAAMHNIDKKVVITYLYFFHKLHVSSLF